MRQALILIALLTLAAAVSRFGAVPALADPLDCVLDCPAGAVLEGEPPLVDGYQDAYNGGCEGAPGGTTFQPHLGPVFCGRAGWFLESGGFEYIDTDWFLLTLPASGTLAITGDAEYATFMYELGPQDCANVQIVQSVTIGPCAEATMTIVGEPGATVWFWVGATTYAPPPDFVGHEYTYVLQFIDDPVAVESRSWASVKGLFD